MGSKSSAGVKQDDGRKWSLPFRFSEQPRNRQRGVRFREADIPERNESSASSEQAQQQNPEDPCDVEHVLFSGLADIPH
jgi:hypothetical protein